MKSSGRGRGLRGPGAGRALVCVAAIGLGCSAEPGVGVGVEMGARPRPPATAPTPAVAEPVAAYVLGEPERRNVGTWVRLGEATWGVLLDGERATVSETGVTLAEETADAPLIAVEVVPARLGGGFLFRTRDALYASPTFGGPLRGVVSLPALIASVSFGPEALLVHASNGERWVIDLASGARRAVAPLGLVDVAALDDGRALSLTQAGGALLSRDGGKSWQDARAQLRGAAGTVVARGGELWLVDELGQGVRTLRLESSGALTEAGALPPLAGAVKPDGRFKNGDSPLRAALRSGAQVGPWTAVVAAGGDVMRVDLATGAIVATAAGVIPQGLSCEAVSVPDDVVFVCAASGRGSVVVSGVRRGAGPHVERAFTKEGPFFAGDDGALAFGGPCAPSSKASGPSTCVRNADGQWEPFSLELSSPSEPAATRPAPVQGVAPEPAATSPGPAKGAAPAGAAKGPVPAPAERKVRWLPRLGRPPVAVLAGAELATLDAAWGESRAWQVDGLGTSVVEALRRQAAPRAWSETAIVDRRWAATATGAVRALLDDGRGIEVTPDGVVTIWPFQFDRVAAAGPRALARAGDGRAFQTLDRGRTWAEVLGPPVARAGLFEPRACSALGCDAGAWLRRGWEATPPAPRAETKRVSRAPGLATPPLLELGCLPTGRSEERTVTMTALSPEDLALGAAFLPKQTPDAETLYEHRSFGRGPVNVALGSVGAGSDTAPRAQLHGFAVTVESSDRPDRPFGEVVVVGAVAAGTRFRDELVFVEPLVPAAPVRRLSFGLEAVEKATKDAGVSLAQFISASNLELNAVVPITPLAGPRAGASGDVLASFAASYLGTLVLIAHGGAAPRPELIFTRLGGVVQSAAQLAGGDIVALVVSDSGTERILRFGGGRAAEVATIAGATTTALAPANPDVIAVGPHGELGVIRTPSGSEPPSAGDPALLIMPGPTLTALAPWSTAVPADDPACAGDPAAYRATIQTTASWLRILGRPAADGATSGMTARVRWSPTRVCVEAIEATESLGTGSSSQPTETVVTATFGPTAAGRATIELGSEARTPLSCALSPR